MLRETGCILINDQTLVMLQFRVRFDQGWRRLDGLTTNMRDEIDGTEECKVTLRDAVSIEHTVTVGAVNRYYAYGLALAKMRQCSWSNPEYRDTDRMAVDLIQTGNRWRRVYVTAAQFEAWLAQCDNTPQRHRDNLKMLLGRMPPNGDFKKGLYAR